MMRNRILSVYSNSTFKTSNSVSIYVADFSQRTKCERKVEVHDYIPLTPNEEKNMDCLNLNNPNRISTDFNIFDDHSFKDENNNDKEHCECCLFPTTNDNNTWVGFVEIKDCKSKNIVEWKDKVKEQIINVVRLFINDHIIDKQRIYGIISFPRRNKVSFDQTIFDDYTEYKKLFKEERIHFIASNNVTIENERSIIPFDDE